MIEENQGLSGRVPTAPGSREPSQQVVSALRASIPRAGLIARLFCLKPFRLTWGTYPQTRKKHTFDGGRFTDAEDASAEAYRVGAHWYVVRDVRGRGREVWSSDHDIAAIRASMPRDSDGSPKGGDAEGGSVACDDSAGRQASPKAAS